MNRVFCTDRPRPRHQSGMKTMLTSVFPWFLYTAFAAIPVASGLGAAGCCPPECCPPECCEICPPECCPPECCPPGCCEDEAAAEPTPEAATESSAATECCETAPPACCQSGCSDGKASR